MSRFGSLLLPVFLLFQTLQAESHEVFGKAEGVTVGYRVEPLNTIDSASITVIFHDDTIVAGNTLAHFFVPTSALENKKDIAGAALTKFRLPGCGAFHEKMGNYRFIGGALEITSTITDAELWNPECKAALGSKGATLKVLFPVMTPQDRSAFGLDSAEQMANCKLVQGRSIPLDGMVGGELTVYPNGWAHDADAYFTSAQRFADMTINTLEQVGPDRWANGTSYVFMLGDKVTVQRIVRSPRAGEHGVVRSHLVEVKRGSDGKGGVVDLDQLIAGTFEQCPIERLVSATKRLMPGVFVKLHPNAKPVYEQSRVWVRDPSLRYGFCQDFVDGRFHCQTREYARPDLAPSSWTVGPDEVDIVTDFPLRGQNITYRTQ